jgi:transposase
MVVDLAALPEDITLLHQLVRELLERLEASGEELARLKQQLAALKRVQFGRKSEPVSPDQLALWAEGLEESRAPAPARTVELGTPARRERPVRKPLPAHLPREEELHDLDACTCPACGGALERIGEEVAEQLDWRAAAFFVRRRIRPKYACRRCETIATAPVPASPIDKGLPGPGLLAQVLTSKYLDHLPLYRQAGIFERYGVEIARSTLVGWVAESTCLLTPLAEAIQAQVLASPVVHTDDTPVPVLEPGRPECSRATAGTCRPMPIPATRRSTRVAPLLRSAAGRTCAASYSSWPRPARVRGRPC